MIFTTVNKKLGPNSFNECINNKLGISIDVAKLIIFSLLLDSLLRRQEQSMTLHAPLMHQRLLTPSTKPLALHNIRTTPLLFESKELDMSKPQNPAYSDPLHQKRSSGGVVSSMVSATEGDIKLI